MARGYLFSDIDGSTQKWERNGAAMQAAMLRHDRIFADLIATYGGFIHDRAGDGVFAIFDAGNPIACALALQLALEREPWPGIGELRVRLGVHVGPRAPAPLGGSANVAERIAVNRAARIAASAWGGQILISAEAADAYAPPARARLVDLGAIHLKGVDGPMQIYGLVHPDMKRTSFAPLRIQEGAQANLPAPSGPLLGRAQELERLLDLIKGAGRLIELVGPAGAGKTRLAQEAARICGATQPVLYAPIESERTGLDLLRLLARALGVPLSGDTDPSLALAEVLRARKWVIVLDNAERASEQAIAALARLVQECRDLVVVCASRSPIGGAGARLRLHGLAQPGEGVEATVASAAYQLFEREARRADVALRADAEVARLFQKLCAATGGLPLALQLSATWLRYLTLEAVVTRVTAPGGHDLSGIFADTWQALDPDLRGALGGLSCFRAPFTVEEAHTVTGAGLSILMALEDRGLLERAADRRFHIHPLLCALVRARAPDAVNEVAQAHATHFLSSQMLGPRPRGEAPTSLDDVEEAWAFGRRAWPIEALKSAGERVFYWCAFGGFFLEGARMFDATGEDNATNEYLAALRANCLVHAHQTEAAATLAGEICRSTDALTRAHGVHALANLAHGRGDFAEAQGLYEEALALRCEQDDRMGAHYTSMSLAALALARGHAQAAGDYLAGAFALAGEHPIALLHAHFFAGEAALAQHRQSDAELNFARALELDALVEHPPFRVRLLLRMSALARARGELGAAAQIADQAAHLARVLGDVRGAGFACVEQGLVALDTGDLQRARAEITSAVRAGLDLRSKPVVARALLALLRVEMQEGDTAAASRLRQVLEGADLGELRSTLEHLTKSSAGDPAAGDAEVASVMEQGARVILRL